MAFIERLPLERACGAAAPGRTEWDALVDAVGAWWRHAAGHGAGAPCLRDAVVLVPFAEHLPLARRAWARAGGWMPRIETTQTLALSLGPTTATAAGQISFDAANDRLTARRILSGQRWAAEWARRDARGWAHAIALVVDAAHALARAAAAVPPAARETYWDEARALLGPLGGPGARERQLARVALEWVAAAGALWPTDRLHALRPAAWIVVQAGGADTLVERLLDAAPEDVPCAVFDTDAALGDPFAALASQVAMPPRVEVGRCDGFEAEAQAAAAQVLAHLARGEQPVALVAQDRTLVRRVRALLERHRVPLDDETGWRLSTTRAGAHVMGLLRAAEPQAGTDAWIEWLKNGPPEAWAGLSSLEARLRRERWTRPQAVDATLLDDAAARVWRLAGAAIEAFLAPPRKPFGDWLRALDAALRATGAHRALETDSAGAQVLAALGLDGTAPEAPAWSVNRREVPMTVDEFRDWVGATLESVTYVPPAPSADGQGAAVIVTPLARAMLRPFAAAVLPGCDEKRLGQGGEAPALLGETLAAALGVAGRAALRDRETLAFAQLLQLPHVTLLRRRADGPEPLAASPLLERLLLATGIDRGGAVASWRDPRAGVRIEPRPVPRPAPVAAALLPMELSASACETLRRCPYAFFARYVLGLRDAREFDDEVAKNDYGHWLHAVLHAFHEERAAGAAGDEVERLCALAREEQARCGLRDDDFLPFRLSLERLAPGYVKWLHEHEGAGARWSEGEREVSCRPAALGGVELRGRLDRVDRTAAGEALLVDYKTSAPQKLRSRMKNRFEDTQLAFYALLMSAQGVEGAALRAVYVSVDGSDGVKPVEHEDVAASAEALLAGLAHDYERLRAGAVLQALGEGAVCEHCDARGLCRRDHWAVEA